MMRILKYLLVLVVLLLAVAVAVPFLVPADKIKAEVLSQIEARTGRKITVDKVNFTIFPTLSLNAENATIGNPAWAPGDMAEVKTLKIGLELMPLLHGEYQLKELVLEKPVITLIKEQNRANWQMGAAQAQTSSAPASSASGKNAPARAAIPDLHLDKITITDGSVTYKDEHGVKTIPDINLTLKAPNFSASAELEISALYENKKVSADLTLAEPLGLADGQKTSVIVKASYGSLDAKWDGTLTLPKSGAPLVTGTITIPALDMAQFQAESEPGAASAPHAAAMPPASERWSDKPIALDGLTKADAEVTISLGKLTLTKTTLENIVAKVQLRGGNLLVTVSPFKAYGGTLNATLAANSAGAFGLEFTAQGAQAEPLLHDFASYDKLSGTINMKTKLGARGDSERALVGSLSGSGNMALTGGKLKGVNIAGLLHNLAGAQGSDSAVTEFSDFSGSYTITRGIATTNDLKLVSDTVRMSGGGTVDLPGWQVHMVLKPVLVADSKQGSGIAVPVDVDGPLDHPHYKADLAGALQENLKDPKQLKQNLKSLRKNLLGGNGLQNLLR